MGAIETILSLFAVVFAAAAVVLAVRSQARQGRIARRNARVGIEVEVNGGRLNVVEIGTRRRGPSFVLLHGSGNHHQDMRVSIGERLSRDGRVLLIDRPGHGWSGRLQGEGGATPESQAIAIHEALAKLGVDSPVLIGHDVGGTVALAYALSYPEDVRGLVVISPLSHPDRIGPTLGQRLAGVPYLGPFLVWLLVPVVGGWSQRRRLAQAFAPQQVPADYYEAVGADMALRPAAYLASAEERRELPDFLEEQSKYYGEIRVPVVVMAGEEDLVTDPERHASPLARAMPGGRWVVLNDVGHMAHHVSPNVIMFEINRLSDQLWSQTVSD